MVKVPNPKALKTLPLMLENFLRRSVAHQKDDGLDFYILTDSFERLLAIKALKLSGWNIAKAARSLNLSRPTFVAIIRRLKIEIANKT